MLTTAQTKAIKIATEAGLRVEVKGEATTSFSSCTVYVYFVRYDVPVAERELKEVILGGVVVQAIKGTNGRAGHHYRNSFGSEIGADAFWALLDSMVERQVDYTEAWKATW